MFPNLKILVEEETFPCFFLCITDFFFVSKWNVLILIRERDLIAFNSLDRLANIDF